ncbi:hypothetical protein P3L10_014305 [Capsicum annuum]
MCCNIEVFSFCIIKGYMYYPIKPPREIDNLNKMQFLYLSKNRLNQLFKLTSNPLYVFPGEIPKDISNLIELEELNLQNNSFSGSLDMEIFNIRDDRDFSFIQQFIRKPPTKHVFYLTHIEELYLTFTNLVGNIPHSISNCSKLTHLELSGNKLTGLIPNSLGYLAHLQILNLEENNLTSDSSLSLLTSLTNCRNLTFLDISFNPLVGVLEASMGNLSTSLIIFQASCSKIKGNNKLTGSIGDNLCKLQRLDVIDLTQNQLSGFLPNCLGKVTSLREIHMGSNILISNTLPSVGNLKDLVVLDLSSNNLVGSLPSEIGNLKAATLIDLSMNQLSNGIPKEI